jgi:dehydrogenase/reductase SDR family member 1
MTPDPTKTHARDAALAGDAAVMRRSGEVLVAAALGLEYGFTDVDGRQPRPLTIADV